MTHTRLRGTPAPWWSKYWIVDVPARRVEVHSQPTPAGYDQVTHHGDGEQIATAAASTVDVSALLG